MAEKLARNRCIVQLAKALAIPTSRLWKTSSIRFSSLRQPRDRMTPSRTCCQRYLVTARTLPSHKVFHCSTPSPQSHLYISRAFTVTFKTWNCWYKLALRCIFGISKVTLRSITRSRLETHPTVNVWRWSRRSVMLGRISLRRSWRSGLRPQRQTKRASSGQLRAGNSIANWKATSLKVGSSKADFVFARRVCDLE